MSLYSKVDCSRTQAAVHTVLQYADQGLHSTPPQDGTSQESTSEWNTQLEKGAVISLLARA